MSFIDYVVKGKETWESRRAASVTDSEDTPTGSCQVNPNSKVVQRPLHRITEEQPIADTTFISFLFNGLSLRSSRKKKANNASLHGWESVIDQVRSYRDSEEQAQAQKEEIELQIARVKNTKPSRPFFDGSDGEIYDVSEETIP